MLLLSSSKNRGEQDNFIIDLYSPKSLGVALLYKENNTTHNKW